MTIQEMHYNFKMKLNKLDTNQYRNFEIPEIDFLLNEAILMFIKMTMNPRYNPIPGFEKTQRDRDDLKNLIVNNYQIQPNIDSVFPNEYIYILPQDYMFYISSKIKLHNIQCGDKIGRLLIKQHDDEFEISPFDKSSYEWGEVNAVFIDNAVKAFTDNNFDLKELYLNYLKQHPYVHFAEGYNTGTYINLKNETLTGHQDCILSEHTHNEIVDIAVLLATEALQLSDLNVKLSKLKLT